MTKNNETEFFETTDGARIAYDVMLPARGELPAQGMPPSQLLITVNGFQRPRTDFRVFRKRLQIQYPHLATVALDNRGIGETTYRDHSTVGLQQMANDVKHVAEKVASDLGLSSYALLGISMGGMISILAADRNPSLSHLILVSTTGGGTLRTFPEAQKNQREFPAWPTDYDGMLARMQPYFGTKFLQKSPLLVDAMVKGLLKGATSASVQKSSSLQYNAGRGFNGSAVLERLQVPTLIVTGDQDFIMPPANSISLHRALSGSTLLTYPNVGHLILVEEPERFVADVGQFLSQKS